MTWQRIDHPHWDAVLKAMVEEHVAETKSPLGARLLNDWNREVERFWQVVPKEMLSRLPRAAVRRRKRSGLNLSLGARHSSGALMSAHCR